MPNLLAILFYKFLVVLSKTCIDHKTSVICYIVRGIQNHPKSLYEVSKLQDKMQGFGKRSLNPLSNY